MTIPPIPICPASITGFFEMKQRSVTRTEVTFVHVLLTIKQTQMDHYLSHMDPRHSDVDTDT